MNIPFKASERRASSRLLAADTLICVAILGTPLMWVVPGGRCEGIVILVAGVCGLIANKLQGTL